jgi:DNA replication protein DnaC
VQLLEHIVDIDEKSRVKRSLERRFADSHLGRYKSMADFDWGWPTKIDRALVLRSLDVGFLAEARNIVLVAPQGLGKSMIAQNIAHQAILSGHSVLFLTAAQLLLDLGAQESSRALDRRLKHYAKVTLLVLDEVGYLAFDNRNADLLFQVVSRRYEKKSLVLTTNLAFRDWPTIFPSATCATALIDRVIHHADVIAIEGESYRLREAKERAAARPVTPPETSPRPKKK